MPPPPATGRTFGLPSREERNLAVPVSAVDEVAYIPADTARKQVEEAEDFEVDAELSLYMLLVWTFFVIDEAPIEVLKPYFFADA